ncbi:hypothetical protein TrVE_jg992 [Triparma verrucosa]|uniref:Uncharacterized protein n=1 Tax=Triparma verrucosa TaxID=1606542 RepID=A0A9W7BHM1_9STRA|nr:hypothetical protein TrVE_jg992 [Triparma verrucosa]
MILAGGSHGSQNGSSTPPPPNSQSTATAGTAATAPALSVRHNTREHSSLGGSNFLGGGAFGSQSPAASNYNSNGDMSSFLEAVMTEEERRTRTRQLPDVEGFAALSKSESKSDIAIVRSYNHAITQHDQLVTPSYEDMEESEDGPFVPPNVVSSDDDDNKPVNLPAASKMNNHLQVSHIVESVSSFNPPRPPESSGANKKRRMTRWEKNPNEIDLDLANYRRTVQKTREELQLAETERIKVEHIASTIRGHFLQSIRASEMESEAVTKETEKTLRELEGINDEINTKKKLGNGMHSTLALMKALGDKIAKAEKGGKKKKKGAVKVEGHGIGGIGGVQVGVEEGGGSIFGSKEVPTKLASAWVLPGDPVSTPYGKGAVTKILPGETIKSKSAQPSSKDAASVVSSLALLPPRLAVQLPYGICYMLPSEVISLVNLGELTDPELVTRWTNMLKSAEITGTYVDADAMSGSICDLGYNIPTGDAALFDPGSAGQAMDVEGIIGASRLVRFGDTMIPTPGGRGGSLGNVKLQQLRQAIGSAVTSRQTSDSGFASTDPALVLPDGFREWEEERLEIYKLRGHLMQLKKIIRRQEIAKNLTEKAYAATVAHEQKQEETCKEALEELDELKTKCGAELKELGISEEKAKEVLAKKLENSNAPSRDPPKKPKKKAKAVDQRNLAPNRSSKRKRGGGRSKTKKARAEEDMEEEEEEQGGGEEPPKRSARGGRGGEPAENEEEEKANDEEQVKEEESLVSMEVDSQDGGDSQDEAPAKKKGGRKPRVPRR